MPILGRLNSIAFYRWHMEPFTEARTHYKPLLLIQLIHCWTTNGRPSPTKVPSRQKSFAASVQCIEFCRILILNQFETWTASHSSIVVNFTIDWRGWSVHNLIFAPGPNYIHWPRIVNLHFVGPVLNRSLLILSVSQPWPYIDRHILIMAFGWKSHSWELATNATASRGGVVTIQCSHNLLNVSSLTQ